MTAGDLSVQRVIRVPGRFGFHVDRRVHVRMARRCWLAVDALRRVGVAVVVHGHALRQPTGFASQRGGTGYQDQRRPDRGRSAMDRSGWRYDQRWPHRLWRTHLGNSGFHRCSILRPPHPDLTTFLNRSTEIVVQRVHTRLVVWIGGEATGGSARFAQQLYNRGLRWDSFGLCMGAVWRMPHGRDGLSL